MKRKEEGKEVVDVEKRPGREQTRNSAYFTFYIRVPDSPESGARS